jgi:glycosyltransferase involved in cell wall biosynthesis
VVHGETGYLAGVGDVDTMAAYGQTILEDESQRAQMGRAAREVAVARFEEGKVVGEYEEYYRERLETGD